MPQLSVPDVVTWQAADGALHVVGTHGAELLDTDDDDGDADEAREDDDGSPAEDALEDPSDEDSTADEAPADDDGRDDAVVDDDGTAADEDEVAARDDAPTEDEGSVPDDVAAAELAWAVELAVELVVPPDWALDDRASDDGGDDVEPEVPRLLLAGSPEEAFTFCGQFSVHSATHSPPVHTKPGAQSPGSSHV